MPKLPTPYFATLAEANQQFARAFSERAAICETEGRPADAARLRQMVVNAVGPEQAKLIRQELEHELQAA